MRSQVILRVVSAVLALSLVVPFTGASVDYAFADGVRTADLKANLHLSAWAPWEAFCGEPFYIDLLVENTGDIGADDVELFVMLDQAVAFEYASDGGAYNATEHKVTWELGSIAAGDDRWVWLVIWAECYWDDVVENHASVNTTTPEYDYSDNEATTWTYIYDWPWVQFGLWKYAPARASPGSEIVYTIEYWDNLCYHWFGDPGPVLIVDTLPGDVEFISASDGGIYADGQVTWEFEYPLSSCWGEVTVTVRVEDETPIGTKLENKAEIWGPYTDIPSEQYNTHSRVTTVSEAVHFPDPNLEDAIREAIGKPTGDIYVSDLEGLTSLDARERNIADLTGLEYCSNLSELHLWGNEITDISPLADLTNLTWLALAINQISNVTPLAGLTNLTWLGIWANEIGDISPLADLANLTDLHLGSNQISDISSLVNLTNLMYLTLGGNQISDISSLGNLTNLTSLHLDDNQISDISPLADLTNLDDLNLWGNRVSDISPLANLTNLTWLYLSHNQISDVSPLDNLTNLTWLYLESNQISDISPLVDNIGLGEGDKVDVRYNYLDLSPGSEAMNDIQTLLDRGVEVLYEPQSEVQYDLTISSTSGGSVITPGEGAFTYDAGTVVDLVAEAEEGYQFVTWTGDVDTVADVNAAETTITMEGNYEITANFEEESRMGAWVDEVVITVEPDAWQAVDKLAAGELDVYALTLGDPALFSVVEEYPDIWYKSSIGSFRTLRINPYGPEFDTGMVNPFYQFEFPAGVRTMNEILHKFIDRDFIANAIMGGLAWPRYTSQHTQLSDYDRYFDGTYIDPAKSISALEDEYRYDEVEGLIWLNVTMAAINDLAPGTITGSAGDGWLYNGAPIGMTVAIRSDDPIRTQIGDYVGDQLEKMGFEFTPYYGDMEATLHGLVSIDEDTTGGNWSLYTGGWVTTTLLRDSGYWFLYFHTNFWSGGIPAFQYLDVPDDFYDAAFDLAFWEFTSFEGRDALYEICLPEHMKYGMLYLVDTRGFSPLRENVNLAADRSGGICGSWMWALTAHFRDTAGNPQVGGQLRTAMHKLLVAPWNPIAGSNTVYDMFPIRATGDMGTHPDTRDGLRWAGRIERAEVSVKTGYPVTATNPWVTLELEDTITAPMDAWRDWDPVMQTPRTVQDALDSPDEPWGLNTAEAVRYSVAYYPRDIWDHPLHDGSTLTFADFLYRWILTYDRGQEESAIYDSAAGLEGTRRDLIGTIFTVGGPTDDFGLKVEVWSDRWETDAERMITDWYPNYAQGNGFWHTIALAVLEEREGSMAFGEVKGGGTTHGWTNFIYGTGILGALDSRLDATRELSSYEDASLPYYGFIADQYTVQGLEGFDAEIGLRMENLREWVDAKGHFWVGSGPFCLEAVDPDEKTVHLKRFEDYPDPADRWLFLLSERHDLTISSTDGGEVTEPGEGVFTYGEGMAVSLVAEAQEGYRFVTWTGDVDSIADVNAAETTITMWGDYSIFANFEEETVYFPDANLEEAIREAIGKPTGDIYQSDLEGLTSLDAPERSIADLTGLEYCTDLSELHLWGNEISDISPLASLTNLTWLDLDNNQISDVSPLANLTSLTRLSLPWNQLSSISLLTNLTNVAHLYLSGNQISNISPLANLTSLTSLELGWNEISDISPLADLTSLTYLNLHTNQISDMSPLENLTSLAGLSLTGNQIGNISPLTHLTNLSLLELGGNQISDISPLANLTNLTSAYLAQNEISDISPLENLTNLTRLNLWQNQIGDISPLANLIGLEHLELWDNQISDISPLADLTNLTWLGLGWNQIEDVSPLADLTSLITLILADNRISDISPLLDNTGIGEGDHVDLRYNHLDLTPGSPAMNDIQALQGRGADVLYEPQTEVQHDLTISSTAGGSVITPGEGTFTYGEGAVVHLLAEAEAGYLFINWSGNVDTIFNVIAADTTITMHDDYEITARFAAIVDSKTETVSDGTVDARAEADTEVEVAGTATVTAARFADNPGGDPPTGFNSLGKHIDVYVTDTDDADEITIRLFYTAAEVPSGVDEDSLRLLWWDGTDWVECSESGVNTGDINGYSGYIWARITDDTAPDLTQLTGTPFGGYGPPPVIRYELTISSTVGGSVTTPGEGVFTLDEVKPVSLMATPSSGYRFVRWTGDVATIAHVDSAATTITMNGNYSISANFEEIPPDVVEIWDWHGLDAIRDNPGGTYILMKDLDSGTAGYAELAGPAADGGKGWQPIGSEDGPFAGVLHGQGYEVKDLFIDRPDEDHVGLFGAVEEGIIEDVGVANAIVIGGGHVGILVGENAGTVTDSHCTGAVTGESYVGGLVGTNEGTLRNSYSTAGVIGDSYVGGLVGWNARGSVNKSYSAGSVTGGESVGGLVGWNDGGTVSDSFWDVEASGVGVSDGGSGKTTEQMVKIDNFSDAAWNIVAVGHGVVFPAYTWNIIHEQTYPFLSWEEARGAKVVAAKTETVTDDTVDAKFEADTEVQVTGTANVTAAKFAANPAGDLPLGYNPVDKYIDVYVPNTDEIIEVEIRLYYTDAEVAAAGVDEESLVLFWWNGEAWEQCSVTGVNPEDTDGYSGYIWARITDDTTPDLAYLIGSYFNGGGRPVTPRHPPPPSPGTTPRPPTGYDLTITATEGGSVTEPGEGEFNYDAGMVVDLVAEAEQGYRFVNWTGDVDTVDDLDAARTTVTMDGHYSIAANFVAQYDLTITGTNGGKITAPGERTFAYDAGMVVNLVAEAEEGYRFANWTGDVDTIADVNAARTTVTMDGHYSIAASFIVQYDLTITGTDGGNVTAPGEGTFTYDEGAVVDLVAEAAEGYRFVTWTGDVDTVADLEAATTITMDSHYSITASFERIVNWPLIAGITAAVAAAAAALVILFLRRRKRRAS